MFCEIDIIMQNILHIKSGYEEHFTEYCYCQSHKTL